MFSPLGGVCGTNAFGTNALPACTPLSTPFPTFHAVVLQFAGYIANEARTFKEADIDMSNFVSFEEVQQMLGQHDEVCLLVFCFKL